MQGEESPRVKNNNAAVLTVEEGAEVVVGWRAGYTLAGYQLAYFFGVRGTGRRYGGRMEVGSEEACGLAVGRQPQGRSPGLETGDG